MKSQLFFIAFILINLFSCTNQQMPVKTNESIENKPDTVQTTFTISGSEKTAVTNGEHIEYYKNGVIKIRGMMKDGQRDGLWKSWYEDGTPWSETTFKNGTKTGKTTAWFENGKKRYEGFFIDNIENGKWTFWDEKGNLVNTKNYK